MQKLIYIYLFSELTVYSVCFLNSIYNIYIGNFDTQTWVLTYNLVLPLNMQAIWKWYLHLFLRFNMGMTYTACTTSVTSYFVACCHYICAACDHLDLTMERTKHDVKELQFECNTQIHQQMISKLTRKLSHAIEIHVKLFE